MLEWWCCTCTFEGMSDQHPNDGTGIFRCWHNHRCDSGTNEPRKKQAYVTNKVEISDVYIFKVKVDKYERENEENYAS